MTERNISILQEAGAAVSSRRGARILRESIEQSIDTGEVDVVNIDFFGVDVATHSFLDGLIAVMIWQRGKEWFNTHIRIKNIDPYNRRELLEAIRLRLDGVIGSAVA